MASLVFQHVSKTFAGGIRAVDDFSLEVADGELLVLVGPSGSGKTTLLRMVAGLEEPTHGSIVVDGQDMGTVAPKDRNVAMVFQHHAIYPHLNVRRNMAFGLKMRGTARAESEQRVTEAAQLLGIDDLLGRRSHELSGGQRQRVALGRAIVRQPRLFLFDEPLSSLDAHLRSRMRREIRQLHARLGTTMLYVTHDQTEAMTLGGRIAVIDQGRLQQVADPTTLYEHPANLAVAGLIGTPTMNFIEGRFQTSPKGLVFQAANLSLPIPGSLAHRLGQHAGKAAILAVRPEDIVLSSDERTDETLSVAATVKDVEVLGSESHVELDAVGHKLLARVPGHGDIQAGDQTRVSWLAKRSHFFDADTGRAI